MTEPIRSVEEQVDAFMETLRQKAASPNTILGYGADLRDFVQFKQMLLDDVPQPLG